jgi:hypothetical protein
VNMILKPFLSNTEAVYYDPGFVPVHVGQRLVGVKTRTPNFTIYLFDHDGERVGWVSGDLVAKYGKEADDSQVYCFVVREVDAQFTNREAKRGKLYGDLYEMVGFKEAAALREDSTDFPKDLGPFIEGSPAYRFFTTTHKGQPLSTSSSKGTTMLISKNAVTSRLSTAVAVNGEAMKNAAFLEAGTIVNKQLTKLASAKLPMMVRGYADSPVGKLVIANLFAVVIREMRKDDKALNRLAEASLEAAHLDMIRTLDIDGLIDELLSSESIKRAMGKVDEVDAAE